MHPEDARAMSCGVTCLADLTCLHMEPGGHGMYDGIAQGIVAACLPGLRKLRALRVPQGTQPQPAANLMTAMSGLRGLQRLDVHNTRMGAGGGAALGSSISVMTGLSSLRLSAACLGDAGAAALAVGMAAITSLVYLAADGNNLTYAGVCALLPAFARHSGLRELHLTSQDPDRRGCALDARAAAALGPVLEQLQQLRKLSHNGLGGAAVRALLWHLARLTELEALALSHNGVTSSCAVTRHIQLQPCKWMETVRTCLAFA
jgi:Ran GTPase-activating protein (RanGAP) involved in mRNA processing and transport